MGSGEDRRQPMNNYRAFATLQVRGSNITWPTSVYRYYGPRSDVLYGTAVLKSAEALCGSVHTLLDLRGLIVVKDTKNAPSIRSSACSASTIYKNLLSVGAKAYVDVNYWAVPGYFVFRHETFELCTYCSSNMTMVDLSGFDGTFEAAVFSSSSTLQIGIRPPHDTQYEDAFTSYTWTIFIRILAPIFAYSASYTALSELISSFKTKPTLLSNWTVRE